MADTKLLQEHVDCRSESAFAELGVALATALTVPVIIAQAGPSADSPVTGANLRKGLVLHMTFDGSEELLYVDGRLQGKLHWKKPGEVGTTDFNLVIGCNRSNLNEPDLGMSFRGLIDEPMMWDRALSEKEVALLFESQGGTSGKR